MRSLDCRRPRGDENAPRAAAYLAADARAEVVIELQNAIKKHGTLTGKEFAERRTALGPAPLSLDELRRSRDYLLDKAEQDEAAKEKRATTASKHHP
jgi:hypothetical protein